MNTEEYPLPSFPPFQQVPSLSFLTPSDALSQPPLIQQSTGNINIRTKKKHISNEELIQELKKIGCTHVGNVGRATPDRKHKKQNRFSGNKLKNTKV